MSGETGTTTPRWRRGLVQIAIFVLVTLNIELFCHWRLQVEGYETQQSTATLHPRWGWKMNAFPDNRINSDGLRGDEIPPPRGGNEVRVLCLGGSVTYGVGVSDRFPFPVQMQNRLRKELTGRDVVVMNGGSSGMASHQFLQVLVDLCDKLEPNIVIVMCGRNEKDADAFLRLEPEAVRGIYRAPDAIDATRTLLYRSATYRYLRWKLRSSPVAEPALAAQPELAAASAVGRDVENQFHYLRKTVQNLELMARFAQARGIHLLLAAEAHRVRTLPPLLGTGSTAYFIEHDFDRLMAHEVDIFGALARALQISFIDMTPAVLSHGYDETVIFRDADAIHYTRFGAGLAADVLGEELARLGWLGEVHLDASNRARPADYPGRDVLPAP